MGTEFNMIKKYRKYIITLILIIAMCVSICFIPIDATRFIPVVEKQFQQDLGVQVHIERLIFRFGPALKIKAPVMHILYEDGQKFGQVDNVKFFVPWSTLFKSDVAVKRIYADKLILKTSSNDKYLPKLLEKLNATEYDAYPNISMHDYMIQYTIADKNKQYKIKGKNLELTKLENYKNLKLVSDGQFYINDKEYITYNLSIAPNIERTDKYNKIDLTELVEQIENIDFHSDIMADVKLYNNSDNQLQISGLVNIDNISVLDPEKKNPKSFIYLTFWGNKTGILSNIYAEADKKIYAEGMVNHSKKPEIDIKVKTDKISLSEIYKKVKLFVDCSKFKGINSIDGTMLADFTIKGDLNKLKSSGFMKISDGVINSSGLKVKNITSDIDFSNNTISISKAVGYVNNAPINLSGKINKNLALDLVMDKVELKNVLPEKYGVKNGIISLNSKISGTVDNIIHKDILIVQNLKAVKDKNTLSFDSLKLDTEKDNTAVISNIQIKPEKTELIKIPNLKISISNDKLKVIESNIFMPNSKIKAKGEISDYNSKDFKFNVNFDGFVNSKDIGFKRSDIYPVKSNISGDIETQNIEGQVQLLRATLLDEPALINVSAKLENDALKIDDLSVLTFNETFSSNLKSNLKGNKKIIISGNIENLKEPVFKNIRLFIPQQININVNDSIAQLKGDIFINGKYDKPELVGQLSAQNLISHLIQLSANNVTVDFNKNIAVINAPVVKVADSSFAINSSVSTDISKGILVKNINFKSKFLNTDTVLMYKDVPLLKNLPVEIAQGKFYSERIASTIYNSPLYMAAVNADFTLKNNILNITNLSSELYNGKMEGSVSYNLKDDNFSSNIASRGVSASPIFDIVAVKKDTVSGIMDFDSNISGNLLSRQSLNGNIKFIVHNGHMGTLGKLEHLLYAQNVIADSMLRTSLSVITKAITLKDTGLFKYLRGDITMKNGVANINMLQSQGPLMSLYIKGQYYPATDYAKLIILGRLSDEVISSLGSFGEFSFNKLMIMLTGDDNKLNIKVDDIDKLPQLPMKNTKEFRSYINGILEKPSSVIQFNWISYTKKSLRQPEVPNSNEKVPDFIEALPY